MVQRKKKAVGTKETGASFLWSLQASGFAVTILALVISGVVILSPSLRVLAEQQQEIAALKEALEESQAEVFQLEEQRERWKDPAFVETQARERLMFVYPGDITYLVIDDVGDDNGDDSGIQVSQDIVAQKTDWRASLLGSYLVAATTSRQVEQDATLDPIVIPSPDQGGSQ